MRTARLLTRGTAPPLPPEQNESQTGAKTLPFPELRLRAVIRIFGLCVNFDFSDAKIKQGNWQKREK